MPNFYLNKKSIAPGLSLHTTIRLMQVHTLSKKKVEILNDLIEETEKSEMRSKHASAVVKSGKIRAVGHNSFRGSIGGNRIPSTHAEISAIYNWLKIGDRSTVDLWVIRVSKLGKLTDSAPCLSCVIAIKKYNVRNVYYSDAHGQIIRVKVGKMDLNETHVTRYQKNHGVYCTWNLGRKWKM